ncbi:MAG: HesA/MoeB/ThiF family protein [Phycisphaerae bacterium]
MAPRKHTWRADLFLPDGVELRDLPAEKKFCGEVDPADRTIHLFPRSASPIGLPTLGRVIGADEPAPADHSLWLRVTDGKAHVCGPVVGEAVEAHVHHLAEIYERTPFAVEQMATLATSRVAMVGIGSVGSSIAEGLARAGVGAFLLADPDVVEIHNLSRHEAGLLDVGRPKAEVAARGITRVNPMADVQICHENIFEWSDRRLRETFEGVDLIVASADRTEVQLEANDLALGSGVIAVFSGLYEEARGGEVFVCYPRPGSPCYACLRSSGQVPRSNHRVAYSNATGAADYEGEPGLQAGIQMVNQVSIQVVLSLLLRNHKDCGLARLVSPDRCYLLVGNALSGGFFRFRRPFDVFFQPLKGPRSSCPECGGQGGHNRHQSGP